ncbi:MAG: FtsX-like permease family protein [Clostridiales bacterium]|nr:FtsX-like permease family protein [Clostridiales bacterium]
MYAIVVLVIGIVVSLSGHRVLLAEEKELAIYRSIGISVPKLRLAFALRYGLSAALGAVAGTIASLMFAEGVVSVILGNFGIGGFHSGMNAVEVGMPAIAIAFLAFAFTWLYAGKIRKIPVTALLQRT